MQTILSSVVVLCSGAWTHKLAGDVGVTVPLMANKHWYFTTDIVPQLTKLAEEGTRLPNLRYPDESIYYKVICGSNHVQYKEQQDIICISVPK